MSLSDLTQAENPASRILFYFIREVLRQEDIDW